MSQEKSKCRLCRMTFGWVLLHIIIIMSRHQHRSPWPSLATLLHRPSLPLGIQCYILYRHRAGHPAFARPWDGVHWCMSLMSSPLLLQQCPIYVVRLILIVFVMGGRWRAAAALSGAASRMRSILLAVFLCNCRQDFFSICLVSVHVVHPYNSIRYLEKTALYFISHMTNSLSLAAHVFASHELISVSVDESLLSWLVNLSTSFRELPFRAEMLPLW